MLQGKILCRDCVTLFEAGSRCPACFSPRLVSHPEHSQLAIAHVDCDAFYAAIEKRDNPALRDKPVIVGGGKRGVVATCCYIARIFGVRSAMPMFKALKLCPDAVVVKPSMEKYAAAARDVRAKMQALTPLVEPLSIDEAFLDLNGTGRLHGMPPSAALAKFAGEVESDIGISVSIGLSHNKFLAKIASDLDKPRGYSVIGKAETLAFLAPRPVSLIWGVGKAAADRLEKLGIRLIADLQARQQDELLRLLGPEGGRLFRLARGIDTRPVDPEGETKSISAETTFNEDISDFQTLARILWKLSEKVSARAKRQGFSSATVTLKLKTADFKLRTRSRTGPHPTQLAKRIFEAGRELLEKECDGARFRLIGIGITNLTGAEQADQGDLADTTAKRDAAAERAIDALREKFGAKTIARGTGLGPGALRK